MHFDALLEVEAAAIAAKKGLHSPTPPSSRAANIDLTLPTARDRAKSYLSSLQRHGGRRPVRRENEAEGRRIRDQHGHHRRRVNRDAIS